MATLSLLVEFSADETMDGAPLIVGPGGRTGM